jgi:spore coat polysaccharide biosynthesis predicted glycosyltransferase SpsG
VPDTTAVDAWREEGAPVHVVPGPPGGEADASATLSLAQQFDWVALDGYQFERAYQDQLVRQSRLLAFDDLGRNDAKARILVNQNPGADVWAARESTTTQHLLGSRYAVLRRELRTLRRAPHAEKLQILVTFGGADDENLALAAMQKLAKLESDFLATVVCTAGEDGFADAKAFAKGEQSRFSVVRPGPMAPHLARTDIAVCAGGTTSLECAALGIAPIVVVTADNQKRGAQSMHEAGAAFLAGEGRAAMPAMARRAAELSANDEYREMLGRRSAELVSRDGVVSIARSMIEQT